MQIELERRREREKIMALLLTKLVGDVTKIKYWHTTTTTPTPAYSSRLQYLFSLFLDCPLGIQGNVQHQSFLFIKSQQQTLYYTQKPPKLWSFGGKKGVA